MKEFFKKEIQVKTTIGKMCVEGLIEAILITAIVVYAITLFASPEMQILAKIVNEHPISLFFAFLPAIIIVVEIGMINTAMLKISTKKEKAKKNTTKKKSKE